MAPTGSGIKQFFGRHWEKMVLWAILIGLFYLLRPFFLLIFQTFLITYVARSVVEWIVARTHFNYRVTTVVVFLALVGLLVAAGAWIGPQLLAETNRVLADFTADGDLQGGDKVNRFVENTVLKIVGEKQGQTLIDSQQYASIVQAVQAEATTAMKEALPRLLQGFLHVLRLSWEILLSLFLSIIFSFILVLDWRRIGGRMRELESSRIRTFYNGAAPHLQAFAGVLGKALRAQAIISVCNTVLTAIGLWYFGVPNLAILSVIVFVFGFIPIAGLFISSVPILLFGAQVGGLALVVKLSVFIVALHIVQAYVLHPKITADVMHMHPILILVLLLVGERFFGIWGMVVGVPIGYYLIRVLTRRDDSLSAVAFDDDRPS
jgi:predicted PurR-regulated permease PerM